MNNLDKFQIVEVEKLKYQLLRVERLIHRMGRSDVIYVFTHIDADGLSSAGILAYLLQSLDKPFIIKPLKQIRPNLLEKIKEDIEPREVIFLDMGGSDPQMVVNKLNTVEKMIIIDHHIPKIVNYQDFVISYAIFNPWLFGANGTSDISSSGLTYLVARVFAKVIPGIYNYSKNAIVGALGDSQDVGDKKSLIGINKLIVEEGKERGIIKEVLDLIIFFKRDSQPLYKALAQIYEPEIPGISGSEEAALDYLRELQIVKTDDDRDKTYSQISQVDKKKLFESLISRLIFTYSDKYSAEQIRDLLVGKVYVFNKEPFGPTRNGREFARLLNACGKLNKPHIGISVAIGDRGYFYEKAIELSNKYQEILSNLYKKALENIEVVDKLIIVNGSNWLDENLTSSIASMLSYSNKLKRSGIIVVIGKGEDDYFKISVRVTPDMKDKFNLKEILDRCSRNIRGASWGGHTVAAGAYIPVEGLDQFINNLKETVKRL